jgi:pSer/pThr/pTyr-binding forkhead associated (FHA) protein
VERVIVVEVLDRRGRVRERVRLSQFPAFVGRAYTNDVVLEDRFVSPRHAAVTRSETAGMTIEDLGSLNGVKPLGEGRYRVGETVLRLVDAEAPVAPAEPLPADESGLLHALRDPRLAIGMVLASVLVFALDTYLGTYYDMELMPLVSQVAVTLGALGLWSGIWAFMNRLLTHRFEYLRHLSCACIAGVAYVIVESISEHAEFVFSSERLGIGLGILGGAVVTYLLLSAHLAVIPASTRSLRRLWATGGTALLLGLVSVLTYTGPDDTEEIPVRAPIKAFGSSLIRTETTAEFLEEVRLLREEVDEDAAEDP